MSRDPRLEQKKVDTAIVNELARLLPDYWTRAELELEFTHSEGGRVSICTTIKSPEGNSEPIQPSQSFFQATHSLIALSAGGKRKLVKARYTLERKTDATWGFRVKLDY
jgi:hypothetical protein